jgi:hypothetical protein
MPHIIVILNNEIDIILDEIQLSYIITNLLNSFVGEVKYTFICYKNYINNYKNIIKSVIKEFNIIDIEPHNFGSIYSIINILNYIDDNEEIIITYSDYIINWSYYNFLLNCRINSLDGCITYINGYHPNKDDNYYYGNIQIDNDKVVNINNMYNIDNDDNLIFGIYYFKYGQYIKKYIRSFEYLDNNIDIANIFTYLINENLLINGYKIKYYMRLTNKLDTKYIINKRKLFENEYNKNINNNEEYMYYSHLFNNILEYPYINTILNKDIYLKKINKKCILIFHQGWGDLFSCNALVKYISTQFIETIVIFRKDAYDMIEYCYNKLKTQNNIRFLYLNKEISDNRLLIANILYAKNKNDDYIILPFGGYYEYLNDTIFKENIGKFGNINTIISYAYSQAFYNSYRIDLSVRFNYFHIERDYDKEDIIYSKYINNINNDYILIHDDPIRNMKITKISTKLTRVNLNGISNIMYDTLKLIEYAKEIHLIDSSYAILIYYFQNRYNSINNKKIFLHKYVRPYNNYNIYKYPSSNWIIVE